MILIRLNRHLTDEIRGLDDAVAKAKAQAAKMAPLSEAAQAKTRLVV